jgi:hypothetical protein
VHLQVGVEIHFVVEEQRDHLLELRPLQGFVFQGHPVFDPIDPHRDRSLRLDVELVLVVLEMAYRRHPALVRLIDQDSHLLRGRLLDLDARHAAIGPAVHLGPDLPLRDVVRPADAIVCSGLDLVLAPEGAEIGARGEDTRPDRLAAFDAVSGGENQLRKEIARSPRRRHAVGEKDDRVVADLFGTALIHEIQIVVGVQVEHARQDGRCVVQLDHLGARKAAPREIGAHLCESSLPNHDAGVSGSGVADPVEEPTSANHHGVALIASRHHRRIGAAAGQRKSRETEHDETSHRPTSSYHVEPSQSSRGASIGERSGTPRRRVAGPARLGRATSRSAARRPA